MMSIGMVLLLMAAVLFLLEVGHRPAGRRGGGYRPVSTRARGAAERTPPTTPSSVNPRVH